MMLERRLLSQKDKPSVRPALEPLRVEETPSRRALSTSAGISCTDRRIAVLGEVEGPGPCCLSLR
eukprot:1712299-Amphidinium_carterae.1